MSRSGCKQKGQRSPLFLGACAKKSHPTVASLAPLLRCAQVGQHALQLRALLASITALDVAAARGQHASWLGATQPPRFLSAEEAAVGGAVQLPRAWHPLLLQPCLPPPPAPPLTKEMQQLMEASAAPRCGAGRVPMLRWWQYLGAVPGCTRSCVCGQCMFCCTPGVLCAAPCRAAHCCRPVLPHPGGPTWAAAQCRPTSCHRPTPCTAAAAPCLICPLCLSWRSQQRPSRWARLAAASPSAAAAAAATAAAAGPSRRSPWT